MCARERESESVCKRGKEFFLMLTKLSVGFFDKKKKFGENEYELSFALTKKFMPRNFRNRRVFNTRITFYLTYWHLLNFC